MAFDDLLPDVFDVTTRVETVVDGRLVETDTALAAGERGRLVWRSPRDVVYDTAGAVVVEADLLTRYPLESGQAVTLADGTRLVVSGEPRRRRGAQAYRHTSAPVRRR